MLATRPELKPKIKGVILAAADIDADLFKRDIAPMMTEFKQNVTLYASSRDWALRASKAFHGYPRLGESGSQLVVLPGIATIDSSAVDTGLLGHSYFAESDSIMSDIGEILGGHDNPDTRPHLTSAKNSLGAGYWLMQKAAP